MAENRKMEALKAMLNGNVQQKEILDAICVAFKALEKAQKVIEANTSQIELEKLKYIAGSLLNLAKSSFTLFDEITKDVKGEGKLENCYWAIGGYLGNAGRISIDLTKMSTWRYVKREKQVAQVESAESKGA